MTDQAAAAVAGRSPLRVLIAERHRTVAQSLTALVRASGGAEVTGIASRPEDAIAMGSRLTPDVAIVDLDMSPNCSLVSGLHALSPSTRIIVLGSRQGQAEDLLNALAAGAVGAIYREDSMDSFHRALERSTRSTPVVADEAAGMLLESYMDVLSEKRKKDVATIGALAAAVEARDMVTGRHLERVSNVATEVMTAIDPDIAAKEEVAYGFMLHDVGKIGIPDDILKKPGPLNDEEWDVMRGHPELGVRIVEPVGFSETTTQIILCHHERWDGSGYPNKMKGEEIPLEARVFSVADAYDALTSDRPYRAAQDRVIALDRIKESSGTMFDPDIVDVFVGLRN